MREPRPRYGFDQGPVLPGPLSPSELAPHVCRYIQQEIDPAGELLTAAYDLVADSGQLLATAGGIPLARLAFYRPDYVLVLGSNGEQTFSRANFVRGAGGRGGLAVARRPAVPPTSRRRPRAVPGQATVRHPPALVGGPPIVETELVAATSLGDVIDRARRQSFVGRQFELRTFDDALAGRSPRRVLFVHGPGGIGKTTLLHEMRARARAAGRSTVLLDGREIDPSPDGLNQAIHAAGGGTVLLIDGYEQLEALDGWLRQELIPSLPAEDVVVLAGREPPVAAWRADPGWRQVVVIHPLDHLDDTDSADLLARADVAAPDRRRLVALGRGHPLALALLADVASSGTVPESLADVPDLISALLESLLRDAPSEAHMVGLATCARAWLTTEDLLRKTVGEAAPEVWGWLRRRPFVVCRPGGLTPHDLTREVLEAEFERRSPERYRALHRIIHDHVVAGIRSTTGLDRQLLAQQLAYLHRRSPLTAAYFALRARGSAAVVPARPEEYDRLVSLIEWGQGAASAGLAERWFADQPDGASVVRTDEGIAGFAYRIICPTGSTMEERDPVARAVLDYVARTAPTRPGERVDIARFFGGVRDYARDMYTVLAGTVTSIITWCTEPLAWSFVVSSDPQFWGPFFDYLGFRPLVEIEFDGRPHVAYGTDWRRFPVDVWLDLMTEREHSGGAGPPPDSALRPPPLSRTAFNDAVRSALQHLNRPDRLTGSQLVGTVLGADATELRASLVAAVDRLAGDPKGDQLRAVLNRTFVRAAPTQEGAAEVLGLPFSTYRRYLAKAVDEVTELLWAVEIGTARSPSSTD
ncbi:MAG TPA: ATP-binding protein [Micromonosporaceae bacterium]|nr:ATP-binding protein [Micromonosporaceae bacterium]